MKLYLCDYLSLFKRSYNCYSSPCENTNSVIGPLCSNLWIVHRSAHLWILDARNLQKEFIASDAHTNMVNLIINEKAITLCDYIVAYIF